MHIKCAVCGKEFDFYKGVWFHYTYGDAVNLCSDICCEWVDNQPHHIKRKLYMKFFDSAESKIMTCQEYLHVRFRIEKKVKSNWNKFKDWLLK